MSLLATVQAAAGTAKRVTESLWQNIVYKSQAASSYNPATGVVSGSSTDYSIKALITEYERGDIGAHIRATDLKAMILISDLAVTPSKDDTVTYDGNDLEVIDFDRDVSKSFWYVQLR